MAAVGSSVDPDPDFFSLEKLFKANYGDATYSQIASCSPVERLLLKELLKPSGKKALEKIRWEFLFGEEKPQHYLDTSGMKSKLKEKCGGDLKKAFYEAAKIIPDNENWKKFVRTSLDLEDEELEKYENDKYSDDTKYEMLSVWKGKQREKTGKNPTADEFNDLLVQFLVENGLRSNIVQIFNGDIHARTFNGVVSAPGPPV